MSLCLFPVKKVLKQKNQKWLLSPTESQLPSSTNLMGAAFPNGLRGGQKFRTASLLGASSGCVNARNSGFPVLAFLKARILVGKLAPDQCCSMLCFAAQQHCQPWDELADSSHINWAKPMEVVENYYFFCCLFWGCIQLLLCNYYWERPFRDGSETDDFWAWDKMNCHRARNKIVSAHQAVRHRHSTLYHVFYLLFYLPFLVRLMIVPKDTPEGVSSSYLQQASKT